MDPVERVHYIEPVHDDDNNDDIGCIYKITVRDQDWVNLIADGRISWGRKSSCTLDSDEEVERWYNQLQEVMTLNCNMMVRSLCCTTMEAREMLTYDGLTKVDEFLRKFESRVLEQQRFDALKWALCATPARW